MKIGQPWSIFVTFALLYVLIGCLRVALDAREKRRDMLLCQCAAAIIITFMLCTLTITH